MSDDFTLKRESDHSPLPCQDHDRRLALVEQTMSGIRSTNEQISSKLDVLITAMTKVALLEERHLSQQVDLNRAHDRIGKTMDLLSAHISTTEAFINYSKGRDKVLWAMGVAVAALIVKALFFAANAGFHP